MRHSPMKRNDPRRGSALLLAIILVATLSVGCAAVWQYMQGTLHRTAQTDRGAEAALLAEAGVEHMIAHLGAHPGTTSAALTGELDEGAYEASAQPVENGRVRILSTGRVLRGGQALKEHRLLVDVLPGPGAPEILRWEEERQP